MGVRWRCENSCQCWHCCKDIGEKYNLDVMEAGEQTIVLKAVDGMDSTDVLQVYAYVGFVTSIFSIFLSLFFLNFPDFFFFPIFSL